MCWRRHAARMVGSFTTSLAVDQEPARRRYRRTELTQARRVGSNPAITPAPVTAAATAPSGGAAFSSTDGAARGRSIRAASITHPNSACFSSLRRVPLERWKGRWRFGIAWIGDDVVDHLVANNEAIRIGDRVILAMVPSDASGR